MVCLTFLFSPIVNSLICCQRLSIKKNNVEIRDILVWIRIRTTDLWNRILLFSSVDDKTPIKN
jgi:hypothetical protein